MVYKDVPGEKEPTRNAIASHGEPLLSLGQEWKDLKPGRRAASLTGRKTQSLGLTALQGAREARQCPTELSSLPATSACIGFLVGSQRTKGLADRFRKCPCTEYGGQGNAEGSGNHPLQLTPSSASLYEQPKKGGEGLRVDLEGKMR